MTYSAEQLPHVEGLGHYAFGFGVQKRLCITFYSKAACDESLYLRVDLKEFLKALLPAHLRHDQIEDDKSDMSDLC